MNSEIIIVPAIVLIPAIVLCLRMWLRHAEKMATLSSHERSPETDLRITRIEQAVESIALEMERVGEGQRFITKVLAERQIEMPRRHGADAGRVNTPH
ncbi:MAG: hypothetical protein ABI969_01505 [bacterium]